MDAHHLSDRLATVAAYVPFGARLADIGSDHAYLPVNLVLTKQIKYAVAGEVVRGPYENAQHEIEQAQVKEQVRPRLADGLAAINTEDQIDTVTIAGMGGALITHILSTGETSLVGVKQLILQPNVGEMLVRTWLMEHHFKIDAERIVKEDDHIYEVIVAKRIKGSVHYSERELKFGPFLLQAKTSIFIEKWQLALQRLEHSLAEMKKAQQMPASKIQDFEKQISEIKEMIA